VGATGKGYWAGHLLPKRTRGSKYRTERTGRPAGSFVVSVACKEGHSDYLDDAVTIDKCIDTIFAFSLNVLGEYQGEFSRFSVDR
jgi:hypothetical protein